MWYADEMLGLSSGWIRNGKSGDRFSRFGWEYWNGKEWRADLDLRIDVVTDTASLVCAGVKIEASGEAAKKRSENLGNFKLTSRFSAGRPVYKKTLDSHQYLMMISGFTTEIKL